MTIVSSPDQIKILKNQKAINKRNLYILETKLKGKLKLPKGETVLSLLGRE